MRGTNHGEIEIFFQKIDILASALEWQNDKKVKIVPLFMDNEIFTSFSMLSNEKKIELWYFKNRINCKI